MVFVAEEDTSLDGGGKEVSGQAVTMATSPSPQLWGWEGEKERNNEAEGTASFQDNHLQRYIYAQ